MLISVDDPSGRGGQYGLKSPKNGQDGLYSCTGAISPSHN